MSIPPILVFDIETTSDDREKAGIVEIAALWLDPSLAGNGSIGFEIKCRPRPKSYWQPRAFEINGCDWQLDESYPTEAEAVESLLTWLAGRPALLAGMNPSFDQHIFKNACLAAASDRHEASKDPFSFRTVDVHSLAVADLVKRGIAIPAEGIKSRLICEAYEIAEEPKPHRAMNGAAWECKLLRRLLGLPV